MEKNMIIHGDCLEVLKTLETNSIDSIVTDPPYGISFMSKKWDYDVPSIEVWQECLRVLKPGVHILCACGTRTQHRMAVNLEDAGFEIRDIVSWVYGSGFPKSLNIGKAVDKLQGNEREVIGDKITGGIKRPAKALKSSDEYDETRTNNYTSGQTIIQETKGNSPYEGWGTALKPAMELWTLGRKPLEEKTVAENVLKYGTGGINIDECRVGTEEITVNRHEGQSNSLVESTKGKWTGKQEIVQGRFPANLIHDGSDEVLELFPDTAKSTGGRIGNKGSALNMMGQEYEAGDPGYGDNGSAARFFYCAKASKSKRNKGCEDLENKCNHPTVKPIKLMRYLVRLITPKGGVVFDPFAGSGSTLIGAKEEGFDYVGIEREQEYIDIINERLGN